jgi:hypothetical protein
MFKTAATDKSAFHELLTKDHHGDAILPKAKDGQEAAPHFLSKVHKLNGRSVVQRNVTPRRGGGYGSSKIACPITDGRLNRRGRRMGVEHRPICADLVGRAFPDLWTRTRQVDSESRQLHFLHTSR